MNWTDFLGRFVAAFLFISALLITLGGSLFVGPLIAQWLFPPMYHLGPWMSLARLGVMLTPFMFAASGWMALFSMESDGDGDE